MHSISNIPFPNGDHILPPNNKIYIRTITEIVKLKMKVLAHHLFTIASGKLFFNNFQIFLKTVVNNRKHFIKRYWCKRKHEAT